MQLGQVVRDEGWARFVCIFFRLSRLSTIYLLKRRAELRQCFMNTSKRVTSLFSSRKAIMNAVRACGSGEEK